MEYEVTLDFGDNAIQEPTTLHSLTDLGLYLERIPNMIGFEIRREVVVKIKTKYSRQRQTELPLDTVLTQ